MTDAEIAEAQRRLMSRQTAATLVLGLLIAEIEDLHPGASDRIVGRLDTIIAHFEANGSMRPEIVAEVKEHARGMISTRNI